MRSALFLVMAGAACLLFGCRAQRRPTTVCPLPPDAEMASLERLVAEARKLPAGERVAFLSGHFLGRPYSAATKARVKKQRAGQKKKEATNAKRLPVRSLTVSFAHQDCMTYVENVLALASAEADYVGSILPHLVNVRYACDVGPLYNDQRSHFMSVWARANAQAGYVRDATGGFDGKAERTETLNLRDGNRTYYVEDRFLIYPEPTTVRYVPSDALVAEEAKLESGDVLVFVRDLVGLDYAHVAFYIRKAGIGYLRHASYSKNAIVDQAFAPYLAENKKILGATVLRPTGRLDVVPPCRFVRRANEAVRAEP